MAIREPDGEMGVAAYLSGSVTEAQLQRTIMDALELGGWLYSHHPDSRRSAGGGGLPDLVAVHPKRGHLVFIECKSATGRLRKRQAEWIKALDLVRSFDQQHVHSWVVSPANLDGAIEALLRLAR